VEDPMRKLLYGVIVFCSSVSPGCFQAEQPHVDRIPDIPPGRASTGKDFQPPPNPLSERPADAAASEGEKPPP
jgi:hypothetical protein